ncbi:MAG: FtsQ-type POTRA domain-containing protein [Clostridia bacterium]|nr:FtsQ-type POTRA domain-containing protein [Clostridia bacterium]
MKHKGIILISTVTVFILATVLSLVWLFKIRHVEISVVAEVSQEIETYEKVNAVIEANYKGKSFFSVSEDDVKAKLCQDPYLNVKSVKKVFPDRLQIEVSKRKERFAFSYNSEYYVTDSEYYLLKKVTSEDQLGEGIIKIFLEQITIDVETLVLGQKIGAENGALVGYMTEIFSRFSDGLNLIEGVTVMGAKNWIRFNTKTGVVIEFSFSPSNPTVSEGEQSAEATALVGKASEVESAYHGLSEYQKRNGYLLVYTKANGEIAIEHVTEHAV